MSTIKTDSNMRNRTWISPAIIIFILVTLSLTQVACQQAANKAARKNESKTTSKSTTTTVRPELKEEGPAYSKPSEAMSYFFNNFFSGNLESAYEATSAEFKYEHPFEEVEKEWREFYDQATEQGITRKKLSYRSNSKELTGDDKGIIVSPNGRMLTRIHYKHLDDGAYKIDNVILFKDSLEVKSQGSTQRKVLTKETSDRNHKSIKELLIEEIAKPSGLSSDDVFIKRLVLSEDWAHAILGVKNPSYESETVILRKAEGKWKVLDSGTGITYDDFPESPYALWKADDWN